LALAHPRRDRVRPRHDADERRHQPHLRQPDGGLLSDGIRLVRNDPANQREHVRLDHEASRATRTCRRVRRRRCASAATARARRSTSSPSSRPITTQSPPAR
jgi:hypothetical protein